MEVVRSIIEIGKVTDERYSYFCFTDPREPNASGLLILNLLRYVFQVASID